MSLASYNTFGAQHYTDGYCTGVPVSRVVITCPHCNAYLWTKELEFIGNDESTFVRKFEYPEANWMGVDYKDVLKSSSYKNFLQEKYLRQVIW